MLKLRYDADAVVAYLIALADGIALQTLSDPERDHAAVIEAGTESARQLAGLLSSGRDLGRARQGGYPDAGLLGLSGQERHRAGREGRTPYSPMSYLTELRMTAGSQGHSEFSMPASPWFANSAGVIPGGSWP